MSRLTIPCALDEKGEDFLDVEKLSWDKELWIGVSEGGTYSTIAVDVEGAEELGRRIAEFLRASAEVTK